MTDSAPCIRLTSVECDGAAKGGIWPLQNRVVGFSMSTRADATDKLTLTADNHDLALFGHPALQHGTILDFRWGYAGHMSQPRRVYLEDFRGFVELEISFSGHERSLNTTAKTRAWTGDSVGSIVRSIARESGFPDSLLHIDDVQDATRAWPQTGETDAAFLQRLAASYAREFLVDATGLHWRRPRKGDSPVATLTYQDEASGILHLEFSSNAARQVGRVELRGRDPMERKTISVSSNGDPLQPILGETVEVIDPNRYATARQRDNAKLSMHPTGAPSPRDAQHEAHARFSAGEADAIEAIATVVGMPGVVARNLLRLAGLPRQLCGNYFVAEAKHATGSGGYTTELRLTRDGAGHREGASVALKDGSLNDKAPSVEPESVEVVDAERYEEGRGR